MEQKVSFCGQSSRSERNKLRPLIQLDPGLVLANDALQVAYDRYNKATHSVVSPMILHRPP